MSSVEEQEEVFLFIIRHQPAVSCRPPLSCLVTPAVQTQQTGQIASRESDQDQVSLLVKDVTG